MAIMSSDTDVVVDPDTYLVDIPHATFARLRSRHAVVWMPDPEVPHRAKGPGFWGVLRHAEIKQVMRDPATYSSYARATQISDPPNEKALDFVRQMMLN